MKVTATFFEQGLRIAAWCCIGVVGIVSLLPAAEVAPVRTSLGGHPEHLMTYAATSMLTALAYLDHSRVKIGTCLVLYAAVLEFLQRYSPGRLPSFGDVAFSAAGILLGIVALHLLQHVRTRQAMARRSRYANEDLNSRS